MEKELFKGDVLEVTIQQVQKSSAVVDNCTLVINGFLEDFKKDPQRITQSWDSLNVRYCNVVRGLRTTNQMIKCNGTAKVPEFMPVKALAQAIGAYMASRSETGIIIGLCREKNGKVYLKVLPAIPACYKMPEVKEEKKAEKVNAEETNVPEKQVQDINSREELLKALSALSPRIGDKVLKEYFSRVLKEITTAKVVVDDKGIVKIA